jgi:hypothetical protein
MFRRNNEQEKMRTLQFKLRHLVDDIVKGDYDRNSRQRVPGTGRPWVQAFRTQIDGIEGFALIDAFGTIDHLFPKLNTRSIVSAVINRKGFFVTADSLSRYDYDPAILSHHVTTYDTLDRLRRDAAEKFDLSIVLRWEEDYIQPAVMPTCWVDHDIEDAVENNNPLLVVRIGRENDFHRIAKHGIQLNRDNTFCFGRFDKKDDPQFLQTKVMEAVQSSCREMFGAGPRWNVNNPAPVQTMSDMSHIPDNSTMEGDESDWDADEDMMENEKPDRITDAAAPMFAFEESQDAEENAEVSTELAMSV